MKIASSFLTAMMAFVLMIASCTVETPNFVVPAPGTGNGQADNGTGNNGNDDNTGQPEVPTASLCDPAFLGQSPMIIAYYTENSSVLPDPACLTHIN